METQGRDMIYVRDLGLANEGWDNGRWIGLPVEGGDAWAAVDAACGAISRGGDFELADADLCGPLGEVGYEVPDYFSDVAALDTLARLAGGLTKEEREAVRAYMGEYPSRYPSDWGNAMAQADEIYVGRLPDHGAMGDDATRLGIALVGEMGIENLSDDELREHFDYQAWGEEISQGYTLTEEGYVPEGGFDCVDISMSDEELLDMAADDLACPDSERARDLEDLAEEDKEDSEKEWLASAAAEAKVYLRSLRWFSNRQAEGVGRLPAATAVACADIMRSLGDEEAFEAWWGYASPPSRDAADEVRLAAMGAAAAGEMGFTRWSAVSWCPPEERLARELVDDVGWDAVSREDLERCLDYASLGESFMGDYAVSGDLYIDMASGPTPSLYNMAELMEMAIDMAPRRAPKAIAR